ncbi:hypothetical protein Selin_1488 [Desulfurispirillum indicum S5]|uniref:Uncharacterized protein n=1 Tax=Desulfurispirillum indicum (strain ATCC BAA-1389 / DSM 22839 / S5) TaxID=653733 RepID=E6W6X8_DESIS|nr:hypothetical protein [Desulfurispirillum indicum]ADU66221.1 hypothetical protein Selin_1488 [Desulfurispirillum indicum S5]
MSQNEYLNRVEARIEVLEIQDLLGKLGSKIGLVAFALGGEISSISEVDHAGLVEVLREVQKELQYIASKVR